MGNPLAHTSTAGRPRRARRISGSLRAGPTCASHFSVVSQSAGRSSESDAVRFAATQHGPDDPCVLVGDRHRRAVEAAPLPKLIDPLIGRVGLVATRSHDGSGAKKTHQRGSKTFRECQRRWESRPVGRSKARPVWRGGGRSRSAPFDSAVASERPLGFGVAVGGQTVPGPNTMRPPMMVLSQIAPRYSD